MGVAALVILDHRTSRLPGLDRDGFPASWQPSTAADIAGPPLPTSPASLAPEDARTAAGAGASAGPVPDAGARAICGRVVDLDGVGVPNVRVAVFEASTELPGACPTPEHEWGWSSAELCWIEDRAGACDRWERECRHCRGVERGVTTDRDGRFKAAVRGDDAPTVRVWLGSRVLHEGRVRLPAPSIRIAFPGRAALRVTSPGIAGPAMLRVTVDGERTLGDGDFSGAGRALEAATWDLAPGSHRLWFRAGAVDRGESWVSGVARIDVQPGCTVELRAEGPRAARVQVSACDDMGRPVPIDGLGLLWEGERLDGRHELASCVEALDRSGETVRLWHLPPVAGLALRIRGRRADPVHLPLTLTPGDEAAPVCASCAPLPAPAPPG